MSVDVVLIGRNEGAYLARSLASVAPQARRMVYVDSGSTDNSVALAEQAGAQVVTLDPSMPFTAARARNEGLAALLAHRDSPDLVQFLDGDCQMADTWLASAEAHLRANPGLGLVTGAQRELRRDATVYNQMFDVEWSRPAGAIIGCPGNMTVRVNAFEQVGGFDSTVIAAEDYEFCARLRKAGWRLELIAAPMAGHDANMTRFAQWWKRCERSGHGFAQVGQIHPDYFRRETLRAWGYGLVLPLIALLGSAMSFFVPAFVGLIYALSYWKTAKDLAHDGLPWSEARHHAMFLTLSKFPNVIGMIRYHRRRLAKSKMYIIEYK